MNSKVYPEEVPDLEIDVDGDFWVLKSSVMVEDKVPTLAVIPDAIPKFQIFKPKPVPVVVNKPKEKIQTIEQEMEAYLPQVFPVRHQDRYVLLKDEASATSFKEIKRFQKQHTSRTQLEALVEFKDIPNVDAYLRILYNECLDLYLLYKRLDFFSFAKSSEKYRYKFIQKLLEQDLILTIDNGDSDKKREIYIVCPFEKLLIEAELIKFKLPLSKAQISKHIKDYDKKIPILDERLLKISNTYVYERAALEKRSASFERSKIIEFKNGDGKDQDKLTEVILSPAQKNVLLQSIINKISVKYDKVLTTATIDPSKPETNAADFKKQWYISDFLLKGLFIKYQSLHSKELSNLQKQLTISVLAKIPLQTIRNYFGEEVAFYFAFLQFYTEWCCWIVIPGTISIILSLVTSSPPSSSISSWLSFFDNHYAILFAFSLNVSSLMFLKFWKRRNQYLSFIWDVDYVLLADSSRIGWKSSPLLTYSPVTGEMVPFETRSTILMRKSISFFFLFICISFLIIVVGLNVGVQAYLANNESIGIPFLDHLGSLGISAAASAVAAVLIIILEFAIDQFTLFLIDLENHQTKSSHLDRYIWTQFLIQFINSFGLMIFLSVIKPVISQVSPSFSYLYGPLLCNFEASGSSCMQSLVLSVSIIFIIQQFTVLVISTGFLLVTKRTLKPGTYANSIDKLLTVITPESFQKEYSSRILQFGTIVLFTSTFPLAPFLALLNNFLHSSLSTHQYLTIYNRPFAVQSNGIGPWESIATILVYLGILINAICIPFLSTGFITTMHTMGVVPDLQAQVVFMITYENFMLLIKFVIDMLVNNVPSSVKIGRLAEKHIHQQRFKTAS